MSLAALARRGIHLATDGEHLNVTAPRGTLTAEDREYLKANKREVIRLLTGRFRSWRIRLKPMGEREREYLMRLNGPLTLAEVRGRLASRYQDFEVLPHEESQGPVACKGCSHFTPDAIGDGTGIGLCAIDAPTDYPRYPDARRRCSGFFPKNMALPCGLEFWEEGERFGLERKGKEGC